MSSVRTVWNRLPCQIERAEDALSSAPDASASHAVLSDTSLGIKRAGGFPIRKEATQADNLNHLASGGARIYTTPDLPLDLTEEEEPVACDRHSG